MSGSNLDRDGLLMLASLLNPAAVRSPQLPRPSRPGRFLVRGAALWSLCVGWHAR